jgi:3-oxoacyl-[acyl-carrier-protein] synthase III
MIRVAVAEDDGLNVLGVDLQGIQVMQDTLAGHACVKQDRAIPLALPDPDQGREAVFRHRQQMVKRVGSHREALDNFRARHQDIDAVVHHQRNFHFIDFWQ